jgi:uncharacterized protein YndB with AHSA1/START domain
MKAMNTNDVIIEGLYPAAPEKVWRAISELEALRKWHFPLDGFEAVTGFRFQFSGGNDKGQTYLHLCEVLEVMEGKKLSYSWQYEGLPGYTVVSFELFEEASGTRVRLTHTGLETLAEAGPDFAKENFVGGWTYFVHTALPKYLEEQA